MKALLAPSLVFLCVSTASAQFANTPAAQGNPPADPPKAADAAVAPANPGNAPAGQTGSGDTIFAALDTDGDGTISKIELRKAIVALKKLDTDNDGALTLAECGGGGANAAGAAVAANDPAQWMNRIMSKDANGDGKLTPNELTENEKQMLQHADQNQDGAIDSQELAAMGQAAGLQPGNAGGVTNGGSVGRRGNEAMGRFFQADRNRDGKLTPDEVPANSGNMMKLADLNGDGAVDAGEMQAFSARMGNGMRAWAAGADPTAPGAANGNRRRPRN